VNTVRTAVRVQGVVQGVGFRPFVYALATGLGLTGLVGNDLDGVFAEVEGPAAAVSEFLRRLERDAPPLARIERVSTRDLPPAESAGFVIAASDARTACASSATQPTGVTDTRSSTAPTAGPGSPSSGTCPTTGR
jgi:hydrogenase maturation protein HypF